VCVCICVKGRWKFKNLVNTRQFQLPLRKGFLSEWVTEGWNERVEGKPSASHPSNPSDVSKASNPSDASKEIHQRTSKSIKIHQIHQNPSNPSKYIKSIKSVTPLYRIFFLKVCRSALIVKLQIRLKVQIRQRIIVEFVKRIEIQFYVSNFHFR